MGHMAADPVQCTNIEAPRHGFSIWAAMAALEESASLGFGVRGTCGQARWAARWAKGSRVSWTKGWERPQVGPIGREWASAVVWATEGKEGEQAGGKQRRRSFGPTGK